jgi:hypothetical protein
MSFGNGASQAKAETLSDLIRVRGLLPDLLHHWLLLNRGRMGHVAAEFMAERRCTTRIDLASCRPRETET